MAKSRSTYLKQLIQLNYNLDKSFLTLDAIVHKEKKSPFIIHFVFLFEAFGCIIWGQLWLRGRAGHPLTARSGV